VRRALAAVLIVAAAGGAWLALRDRAEPPGSRAGPDATPQRLSVDEVGDWLRAREESAPARAAPPGTGSASAPTAAAEETGPVLTVGARLLDEGARPVAGGSLAWLAEDEEGWPVERPGGTSDRGGAVWLAVPLEELEGGRALTLVAGGSGRMRTALPLDAARGQGGSVVSLGEVTLRAGGDVVGRVLDPDGAPLAGARVGLGPARAPDPEAARVWAWIEPLGLGNAPPVALTDADGRFRIPGAPVGSFALVAGPPSPGPAWIPARLAEVRIAPGTEASAGELRLARPAAEELLEGRVLAADGRALEGIRIWLEDPTRGSRLPAATRSAADGGFRLVVPRGRTVRLVASDPQGGEPAVVPDARAGGPALELRLAR